MHNLNLRFDPKNLLVGKPGQSLLSTSMWWAWTITFLVFIATLIAAFVVGRVSVMFLTAFLVFWYYRYTLYLRALNFSIFKKLEQIVNVGQLVDNDTRRRTMTNHPQVVQSAVIDYRENSKNIQITIYPRGCQNSKNVYELTSRISEIFNKNAIIEHKNRNCCVYRMNKKDCTRIDVDDSTFN